LFRSRESTAYFRHLEAKAFNEDDEFSGMPGNETRREPGVPDCRIGLGFFYFLLEVSIIIGVFWYILLKVSPKNGRLHQVSRE
jgi:hypothetical protein